MIQSDDTGLTIVRVSLILENESKSAACVCVHFLRVKSHGQSINRCLERSGECRVVLISLGLPANKMRAAVDPFPVSCGSVFIADFHRDDPLSVYVTICAALCHHADHPARFLVDRSADLPPGMLRRLVPRLPFSVFGTPTKTY